MILVNEGIQVRKRKLVGRLVNREAIVVIGVVR